MATLALGGKTLQRSFRDPGGFVFRFGGRILRAVEQPDFEMLKTFLACPVAHDLIRDGKLIATSFPDPSERAFVFADGDAKYSLAEHEPVLFPSFPAEWSAVMLQSAAELTLELAERTLPHGWRLKDATPYNILFLGPNPVFIDVLSFERRDPSDALWAAYAQFVRTFLLPLLAHRDSLCALEQIWLKNRDGLEPEHVHRVLPWRRRLTQPALTLVSLPVWFSKRAKQDTALYQPRSFEPEQAEYVLAKMFTGLRRNLRRVATGSARDSVWMRYLETQTHYNADEFATKEAFVNQVLREFQPRMVLDVGSNTGHFSELAARAGASVVAIDTEEPVAAQVWRRAKEKSLDILPLVVDLCRPTPAVGWKNREYDSFLDRARGKFDLVLMLAVVHHMLVSERVPLDEILSLIADLTASLLILEFVEPPDPMFRQIARGRDALYSHLTCEYFESTCASRFEILRKHVVVTGNRTLYLLRRKV